MHPLLSLKVCIFIKRPLFFTMPLLMQSQAKCMGYECPRSRCQNFQACIILIKAIPKSPQTCIQPPKQIPKICDRASTLAILQCSGLLLTSYETI
ncbi:hypothetical protein CC78DRAFT_108610 [Lojkania enalia]|uniref:Uncharacterized protein n=1 Tax=Lojkania enalia TaxID=147567 RepID=A0A9P4N605_9PLEO|nr:hypothetical protein CC78DRAFT_108610 [Didymosphaeria enalia]